MNKGCLRCFETLTKEKKNYTEVEGGGRCFKNTLPGTSSRKKSHYFQKHVQDDVWAKGAFPGVKTLKHMGLKYVYGVDSNETDQRTYPTLNVGNLTNEGHLLTQKARNCACTKDFDRRIEGNGADVRT